MVSGEGWICRNERQFDLFVDHIRKNWDFEKEPLSIKWQGFRAKTLPQNSLVHKWHEIIAGYLNETEVVKSKGLFYTKDDVKRLMKGHYGVRIEVYDPVTDSMKAMLKSYSEYTAGEMHHHMQLIDHWAASIGCVLPVTGEYETLKNRQTR